MKGGWPPRFFLWENLEKTREVKAPQANGGPAQGKFMSVWRCIAAILRLAKKQDMSCRMTAERLCGRGRVPTDQHRLAKVCADLPPGMKVGLESGTNHVVASRRLSADGMHPEVWDAFEGRAKARRLGQKSATDGSPSAARRSCARCCASARIKRRSRPIRGKAICGPISRWPSERLARILRRVWRDRQGNASLLLVG